MPPTVRALQYIFTTEVLNEKVFKLLEEKIFSNKKKDWPQGDGSVAYTGTRCSTPCHEYKLGQVAFDGKRG